MPRRPLSIAIISWFLIVVGITTAISMPFSMRNPELTSMMATAAVPVAVQFLMMGLSAVIGLACGFLMLKGKGSGRLVYVVWTAFSFVFGLLTSPAKLMLLPGMILFLVILFFLYRPAANRFFAGQVVG